MAVAGDTDIDIPRGQLTPSRAGPGGRRLRPGHRRKLELALLLAPGLVLFIGFVLLPIVLAAYDGMYKWSGFGALGPFAGLYNYRLVLSDPVFRQAFMHNLIIVVASIVSQLPLGLGMALLLNRRIRGRALLRTLAFAPFVLPYATTAVMWLLLLQPGGFVDQVMKLAGLGGLIQLWLANLHLVIYTMIVVLTWQFFGFAMILMLADLQGIPAELREAAQLDGATAWRTTWHITLPLLGPTIRIWLFLSIIGSLQVFDQVWIITGGGPANASSTMVTYLILRGFQSYAFGYGSAVAVIIFLISFIFALLYQRFVLRRDTRGALTRAVG
ncbi:MAG TPA: sugar ABC transporter permease [Streptosporangiaceae bacterium]|nr:sugar ABC transporter permease [Streptosporangiaceae bacterium]